MFDKGTEDIKNKTALPQREYAALDMKAYANFSKMYVSFYIHKVIALYKEILKCDIPQSYLLPDYPFLKIKTPSSGCIHIKLSQKFILAHLKCFLFL